MIRRALWVAVVLAGCYRPTITDGGYLCDLTAGVSPCPDGFSCDMTLTPPSCWRGPHDAGSGDRGDGAGDALEAGRDAGPDADANPGIGELGPCAGIGQCAAGLVCVPDTCGGRCYRSCTSDADCPGAACAKVTPGGGTACDVPFVACVPTAKSAGGQTGCALAAQACFLSSSHADKTLCDCPGGAREGASCADSRDCLPGLVCFDPTGQGQPKCQQVCVRGDDASCAPSICQQFVGSDGVTSNPTFGLCF
jgi:hypothetical protein